MCWVLKNWNKWNVFDWNVRLYVLPLLCSTEFQYITEKSCVHITIYYRSHLVSRAAWIQVKYPKQNMHLIEQMFPQKPKRWWFHEIKSDMKNLFLLAALGNIDWLSGLCRQSTQLAENKWQCGIVSADMQSDISTYTLNRGVDSEMSIHYHPWWHANRSLQLLWPNWCSSLSLRSSLILICGIIR